MKTMSKLFAFTLSETLLTLAIIGVIAALTIPTLKNHSEEKKFVALTQKAYATISDATARIETQYGNTQFWDWTAYATGEDAYTDDDDKNVGGPNLVRSWYKRAMNVGGNVDESIDYGIPYIGLNGQKTGAAMRKKATIVTADGMYWQIGGDTTTPGPYAVVDVNGAAQPNIMGIDVHCFNITNDGVVPAGTPGSTNWFGGSAWDCTAYVIKYGTMPWLNKSMTECPKI